MNEKPPFEDETTVPGPEKFNTDHASDDEPNVLTDEEKHDLFIKQLKNSKNKFKTGKTYGTEYKKNRKRKNKTQKASRKKNR